MKSIITIMVLVFLAACSSLPKRIEPRSLDFARMKMKVAREAQHQRDYNRAAMLYRDAYDYYTRIDDIKGKIESSLALARQFFYLDRIEERDRWLKRASELIGNNMPEMAGAKAVLQVEMAFFAEDYGKILEIAAAVDTRHPEWQMELACMTMAAKSRLQQDYAPAFRQVLSLLPELEKRFRKGKIEDAGVLSQAYYYSGYIYSREGKWQEAAGYFQKAKTVDGQIDNAHGLANDLYALAKCYEKLGYTLRAQDALKRAQEIFKLLGDKEMLKKLKR